MRQDRIDRLRGRFDTMWSTLGCAPTLCASTFDGLVTRYSEEHRAYHTLQHLDECFEIFDSVRHLAVDAPRVDCALWYHDAVYDTHADDSELRSAALATTELGAAGLAPDLCRIIHDLVLATDHRVVTRDADSLLIVESDLAILGASRSRFAEYEEQIRFEYRWVPAARFAEGRRRVLKSFVDRPRIFQTQAIHDALEASARDNVDRALQKA